MAYREMEYAGGGIITPSGASTTAIPTATEQKVNQIQLTAGHTYLVSVSHDWDSNPANVYTKDMLTLGTWSNVVAISRNPNGMYESGGIAMTTIVEASDDVYVMYYVRHNASATINLRNLKFVAYQLD